MYSDVSFYLNITDLITYSKTCRKINHLCMQTYKRYRERNLVHWKSLSFRYQTISGLRYQPLQAFLKLLSSSIDLTSYDKYNRLFFIFYPAMGSYQDLYPWPKFTIILSEMELSEERKVLKGCLWLDKELHLTVMDKLDQL